MDASEKVVGFKEGLCLIRQQPVIPLVSPRRKKNCRTLFNKICAFDIETTNVDEIEHSFIYHWQFQWGFDFTIIGRTVQELEFFFDDLNDYLCHIGLTLPIFVHNLSFEFQFLSGIMDFQRENVICMDSRKVLQASHGGLEFRCSYLQTGMSLEKLTREYNVKHGKLSGENYNYSKYRSSSYIMGPLELEYALNDVRGLVEAMYYRMKATDDDLYSLPHTKTGYVRRKALEKLGGYIRSNKRKQDYEIYTYLRRAFRGGNCHANRYYTGMILENVKSYDRVSSYPEVMVNKEYPNCEWSEEPPYSFDVFLENGYAMLFEIRMDDVRLKDDFWPIPYISLSKCTEVGTDVILDNGRILECRHLKTVLTDVDYRIICDEYEFTPTITRLWVCNYEKLPPPLISLVLELFENKTRLKGVEGREDDYRMNKEDLNSTYGMCVQDPGKKKYVYEGGFVLDDTPEIEQYENYIKNTPLLYAWGVWIAAHARAELEKGIRRSLYTCVYVDTDSVKCISNTNFDGINADYYILSEMNGGIAYDKKGVKHVLGVFEEDGDYQKFITFGAKKYAYISEGEITTTIAGVNKKKGGKEVIKKGGFDKLGEGFIFTESGGTESVYNDVTEPFFYKGELINKNIYMRDSTYTISLTDDYKAIIEVCSRNREILKHRLKQNNIIE